MEKLVPDTSYVGHAKPERRAKSRQTTLLARAVVVPSRNETTERLVHLPFDRDHGVAVDELDEGEQVGLASTPSRPQVHTALEQALNKGSTRAVRAGVQNRANRGRNVVGVDPGMGEFISRVALLPVALLSGEVPDYVLGLGDLAGIEEVTHRLLGDV